MKISIKKLSFKNKLLLIVAAFTVTNAISVINSTPAKAMGVTYLGTKEVKVTRLETILYHGNVWVTISDNWSNAVEIHYTHGVHRITTSH
ncbi:hypothetical protein GHI93_11175 [Lactococcus hircilactis]|uniref:Uncharacterized protein n=1 Tax=Lactococcus hircilactis TaxID=1494462 RepID=A0A7X2D2V2_9LACT|nr:hypothetical protein [Lactococcus hircilactis]MQW40480.1 hypothetical protein [Lactococcus hircilactis]